MNIRLMNKLKLLIFLVIVISIGLFLGCKKDKTNTFPSVYVDFYIDPNSTIYLELNTPGGWVYLTGGVDGIIAYRVGVDDFRAFDRACPYENYAVGSRVDVESSNTTAIDSNACGSRFVLLDGSVLKGPATKPLHQYNAVYDGQYLHIYNWFENNSSSCLVLKYVDKNKIVNSN